MIVGKQLAYFSLMDNLIINGTFMVCDCRRSEFYFYCCHCMIELMFPLVEDKGGRGECDGNQSGMYDCCSGQYP